LNADSKSVYFGWQRPLILLSKSLRQQSRHRVQNYQSYDEVFLFVQKLILLKSRFVDGLRQDSTHPPNSLVYVFVQSPISPASISLHLGNVPKDFAYVLLLEKMPFHLSFLVTSFLIRGYDYRDHRRRVEQLQHLLVYWIYGAAAAAAHSSQTLLLWSVVPRLSYRLPAASSMIIFLLVQILLAAVYHQKNAENLG